jgi:hypothetical protein
MHPTTSLQIRPMIHIYVPHFQLRTNCADFSGIFAGFFFIVFHLGHFIPGDLFFFEYLARK